MIVGDNFFDGLQVVFGSMLVWSEVRISVVGKLSSIEDRGQTDRVLTLTFGFDPHEPW